MSVNPVKVTIKINANQHRLEREKGRKKGGERKRKGRKGGRREKGKR